MAPTINGMGIGSFREGHSRKGFVRVWSRPHEVRPLPEVEAEFVETASCRLDPFAPPCGRLESTYCGHSRPLLWTPRLGGILPFRFHSLNGNLGANSGRSSWNAAYD